MVEIRTRDKQAMDKYLVNVTSREPNLNNVLLLSLFSLFFIPPMFDTPILLSYCSYSGICWWC